MQRLRGLTRFPVDQILQSWLQVAIISWLWTFPCMIAIYTWCGHSCVTVCDQMPGRTWNSMYRESQYPGQAIASVPGLAASQAIASGVSYCEYMYGGNGVVPTPSFVGASAPEYYIFSSHMGLLSLLLALGYQEVHQAMLLELTESQVNDETKRKWMITEVFMRCLAVTSVVCLGLCGLISVANDPLHHNIVAGSFFFAQTIHTWWLWASQYIAYVGCHSQNSWSKQARQLRAAAPRQKIKVALSVGYVVFLLATAALLVTTDMRVILRVVGPLLEYCLIALQDCALLTIAADLVAWKEQGMQTILVFDPSNQTPAKTKEVLLVRLAVQVLLAGGCVCLFLLLSVLFVSWGHY